MGDDFPVDTTDAERQPRSRSRSGSKQAQRSTSRNTKKKHKSRLSVSHGQRGVEAACRSRSASGALGALCVAGHQKENESSSETDEQTAEPTEMVMDGRQKELGDKGKEVEEEKEKRAETDSGEDEDTEDDEYDEEGDEDEDGDFDSSSEDENEDDDNSTDSTPTTSSPQEETQQQIAALKRTQETEERSRAAEARRREVEERRKEADERRRQAAARNSDHDRKDGENDKNHIRGYRSGSHLLDDTAARRTLSASAVHAEKSVPSDADSIEEEEVCQEEGVKQSIVGEEDQEEEGKKEGTDMETKGKRKVKDRKRREKRDKRKGKHKDKEKDHEEKKHGKESRDKDKESKREKSEKEKDDEEKKHGKENRDKDKESKREKSEKEKDQEQEKKYSEREKGKKERKKDKEKKKDREKEKLKEKEKENDDEKEEQKDEEIEEHAKAKGQEREDKNHDPQETEGVKSDNEGVEKEQEEEFETKDAGQRGGDEEKEKGAERVEDSSSEEENDEKKGSDEEKEEEEMARDGELLEKTRGAERAREKREKEQEETEKKEKKREKEKKEGEEKEKEQEKTEKGKEKGKGKEMGEKNKKMEENDENENESDEEKKKEKQKEKDRKEREKKENDQKEKEEKERKEKEKDEEKEENMRKDIKEGDKKDKIQNEKDKMNNEKDNDEEEKKEKEKRERHEKNKSERSEKQEKRVKEVEKKEKGNEKDEKKEKEKTERENTASEKERKEVETGSEEPNKRERKDKRDKARVEKEKDEKDEVKRTNENDEKIEDSSSKEKREKKEKEEKERREKEKKEKQKKDECEKRGKHEKKGKEKKERENDNDKKQKEKIDTEKDEKKAQDSGKAKDKDKKHKEKKEKAEDKNSRKRVKDKRKSEEDEREDEHPEMEKLGENSKANDEGRDADEEKEDETRQDEKREKANGPSEDKPDEKESSRKIKKSRSHTTKELLRDRRKDKEEKEKEKEKDRRKERERRKEKTGAKDSKGKDKSKHHDPPAFPENDPDTDEEEDDDLAEEERRVHKLMFRKLSADSDLKRADSPAPRQRNEDGPLRSRADTPMLLQRPLSVTIGRRGTENSPPVEDLTQKDKEKDNEKEKEKERVNEVEQKEGDGSKEKSLTPRPANVKARRLSIGPSFLHRLGKSKSDVGKRPKSLMVSGDRDRVSSGLSSSGSAPSSALSVPKQAALQVLQSWWRWQLVRKRLRAQGGSMQQAHGRATALVNMYLLEKSFRSALETLLMYYFWPLMESRGKLAPGRNIRSQHRPPKVKAEEVQSLCGAIEQLFLVHRDLSDGIVTRAERGVCADDCGRFIFQVVRRMGCYFKFAVVYAQTREWVRTQSTKQLKSWLGKVAEERKALMLNNREATPFMSLLMLPLRHLGRLMAPVKELWINTPTASRDFPGAIAAVAALEQCDQYVSYCFNEELLSMQLGLMEVRMLGDPGLPLFRPGRKMIHQGPIGFFGSNGSEKACTCIVFEDMVYVVKQTASYSMKMVANWPVKDMKMEIIDPSHNQPTQRTFSIIAEGKKWKFVRGQETWCDIFDSLIRRNEEDLFNVPLAALLQREQMAVPAFVTMLTHNLAKSLCLDGLFRVAPNQQMVRRLRKRLNKPVMDVDLTTSSPYDIVALLIAFLEELPEPVLPFDPQEKWMLCDTQMTDDELLAATVETVEHLPEGNRKLLHYIVAFLASSSPGPRAVSEMAIAVAPAVIRPSFPRANYCCNVARAVRCFSLLIPNARMLLPSDDGESPPSSVMDLLKADPFGRWRQELRGGDETIVAMLTPHSALSTLYKMAVHPAEGMEHEMVAASQILAHDVVLDKFARDSKLLDRLFQDLADAATAVREQKPLKSAVLSRPVVDTLTILFRHGSDALHVYLKERSQVDGYMLHALGSETVGGMLQGLVRVGPHPPSLRSIVATWGVKGLVDLATCDVPNIVEGEVNFLRQLFACETIMLSEEASDLRERLCEASTVDPLVLRSLNEDDACSPALLSLLRDIIRRVGRQQLMLIEKEEKDSKKLPPVIDAILTHGGDIMRPLNDAASPSFAGKPLGMHRLLLVAIVEAVTSTPSLNVERVLLQRCPEIMITILDLFFAFPHHNILHSVITLLIVEILKRDKRSLLLSLLLHQCEFTQRIQRAFRQNDLLMKNEKYPEGARMGYMGHLVHMGNALEASEHGSKVGASNNYDPQWVKFVKSTLATENDRGEWTGGASPASLLGGASMGLESGVQLGEGWSMDTLQ